MPALLVVPEDVGRLVEEADGGEEEVVEIECAGLAEPLLVPGGEPGDLAVAVGGGVLVEVRRVEHLVLRPADRPEDGRGSVLPGRRQVRVLEDLPHEGSLVIRVVDDEARRDPDRLAVAAEQACTERMERPHRDVPAGIVPDEAHDPLPHLGGGLVRERHGEDPPGSDVLHADEVRDAVREHARLPTPGACEDEHRAFGGGDRPSLLRVQAREDRLAERGAIDRRRRALGIALRTLRGRGTGGELILLGPPADRRDHVRAHADERIVGSCIGGVRRVVGLERLVVGGRVQGHRPILRAAALRCPPAGPGGIVASENGRPTVRGSAARSHPPTPGRRAERRPSPPRRTCPSSWSRRSWSLRPSSR